MRHLTATAELAAIIAKLAVGSDIPCPPVKRLDGTELTVPQIRATLKRATPLGWRIATRVIRGALVIYRVA